MSKLQNVSKELLETLESIQIYGGATEYTTDADYQKCNIVCNCTQDGCNNDLCTLSLTCMPTFTFSCELRQLPQCLGGIYSLC